MHCTHVVLWVRDVAASRECYVNMLECSERRFAADEGFLSIAAGDFIINFYAIAPQKPMPVGYPAGVAHLGFELPTRLLVDRFYNIARKSKVGKLTSTEEFVARSAESGPYRFYFEDPDGYIIEIGTWEGVEE